MLRLEKRPLRPPSGSYSRRLAAECVREQLDDGASPPPGKVVDLLATGDAGDGDGRVAVRAPDGGKEPVLTHGLRDVVVLRLEAEGAGHAAAAGIDEFDVVAGDEAQCPHRGLAANERLLVAVRMQQDPHREVVSKKVRDLGVVRRELRHEFIDEDGLIGDQGGGFARNEVGVFVAEGEEAGRFDADDRRALLGVGLQEPDIGLGPLAGEHQLALGDRGPTAAAELLDDADAETEGFQHLHGGLARARLVEVGEGVGEEDCFAAGRAGTGEGTGRPPALEGTSREAWQGAALVDARCTL